MCTRKLAVTVSTIACTIAVAHAQAPKSPHETTKATIDGAAISVTYGRPSVRARKIMGALVPYGTVWRTGADEATTLTTDKAGPGRAADDQRRQEPGRRRRAEGRVGEHRADGPGDGQAVGLPGC